MIFYFLLIWDISPRLSRERIENRIYTIEGDQKDVSSLGGTTKKNFYWFQSWYVKLLFFELKLTLSTGLYWVFMKLLKKKLKQLFEKKAQKSGQPCWDFVLRG